VTTCAACDARNPPAARFCGRCGATLAAGSGAAGGAPEPPGTGRRGPPEVGPPPPHPERSILDPPASRPPAAPSARARRTRRRRRTAAGVAVAVLVLWWVLGGGGEGGSDGLDDARTLPLPAAGEVAAGFVAGHPVFVVHDEGGDVRVLDATDPHAPGANVLAFCRPVEVFEDLRHGSHFTRDGTWLGGPAPSGLAAYEVVARDADTVTIGERGDAPGRPAPEELAVGPAAPTCTQRLVGAVDGSPDPSATDDLVVHDGPAIDEDERWYPTSAAILGGWLDDVTGRG
jgi:hypothetical protein